MATSATVSGAESAPEGAVSALEAQLRRLLDSPEFSSSKRLSEFFAFICEAALSGREDLGQYEIAEEFLHRGKDFNPLDDASVRKLASQTRRKLESYYAGRGRHDPVIVTLPLRNYLPRFRYRDEANETGGDPRPAAEKVPAENAAAAETPPAEAKPPGSPLLERRPDVGRRVGGKWILLTAGLLLGMLAGVRVLSTADPFGSDADPKEPEDGVFRLVTSAGDIMHAGGDAAPNAILVGPPVARGEDLTARLEFVPERATHQAGIMVFQSPDEYVKLGRHFNDRARLEFGYETGARYLKTSATFAFDESGQNGSPIWLKIRRADERYQGFVSSDGSTWRRFGEELTPPAHLGETRLAIYALNGRTDAPPANARFGQIGVGLWFHDRAGVVDDSGGVEGWTLSSRPGEAVEISEDRGALLVRLVPSAESSIWRMLTAAPDGDWTLETKLDFSPSGGAYAGLCLVGSDGGLRLIRWGLNGGSITLEHLVNTQVSVPDFPGDPPITLRLVAKNGILRAYTSRDGRRFAAIADKIRLTALGSNLRFGLTTGSSTWSEPHRPIQPRFYYVQRMVSSLRSFESSNGSPR